MSAYKKLSKSDLIVIPYIANKEWTITYTSPSSSNQIKVFTGTNITSSFVTSSAQNFDGTYTQLIYTGINHLFYQSYPNNLNTQSLASSFYYESASIYRPTSSYFIYDSNPYLIKNFPTASGNNIEVISIDPVVYGNKIKPGTFFVSIDNGAVALRDDGNGNLYYAEGPSPVYTNLGHAGNIFYSHGLAIITNQAYVGSIINSGSIFTFQNEHTIYTQIVKCTINEYEMNTSYNPSLKKYRNSPSSSIHDFATGSLFQPYVTTVGLYNDKTELLAVAKLSKPIPLSQYIDTNFIIKLDV